VYANALGRGALDVDGTVLGHLAGDFATNGNRVDALLTDLVTSDAFRFVAPM
jgi:hypothetical protein